MAPTSSTSTTLKAATDFAATDGSDFDLEIETVTSAAIPGALLNDTGDGCGSTCQSACSNSTCISGG
ncbi:FxLD family lanthipeptide [Streptomyces longwoodensis]|uniref:FxLD family lanthipeptide n=1 Tax=Streptomyces longwoodensis TaxID=68231 RepID=UPI002F90CAE9|nr:FxLD family lanthipeptide [Streptomyces longwoodensis]